MRPSTFYADKTQPNQCYEVSRISMVFISLLLCGYYFPNSMDKMLPIVAYCIGFTGMLASSSSFHRIPWRLETEVWIRRLDYVTISVMIAGCFTPLCVGIQKYLQFICTLDFVGRSRLCIFLNLIWVNSPKVFQHRYTVLG